MKKKRFLFPLTAILILGSCSSQKPTGKFYYCQGSTNDYQSDFYYSDSYFSESSLIYNPSLATCSLSFAMASFASNRNGNKNDYSKRYRNAEALLTKAGFRNFDVNSYYKEKPGTDSLGVVFASKKIGDKTLVAVGVRGGNYEREWASNFTLGDGSKQKQAEGFFEASTIYLNSLDEYLKKYDIQGDIKLWGVGYSRGGATNNLACGRIDQMLKNSEYLFGTKARLQREDLYSYCFEPPQGASFEEEISPRDALYDNIHNIVNFNDPVPKVAMSALRFTRYGIDHYLLDSVYNPEYEKCIGKVKEFYQSSDNADALGTYAIDTFVMGENSGTKRLVNNYTSGLFLSDFIDELVRLGIPDLSYYVNNYQAGMRTVFQTLYRGGNPKSTAVSVGLSLVRHLLYETDVDYLISLLSSDMNTFVREILLLLSDTLKSFDIDIDYDSLFTSLKNLALSIAKVLYHHMDYFKTLVSLSNVKAFGSAHYPELCLAHLKSQDKNFNPNVVSYDMSGTHYILTLFSFTEQTKLTIMKGGHTILKIKDGEIALGSKLTAKIEGETARVYLPASVDYRLELEETGYRFFRFEQKKENPVLIKEGEATKAEKMDISSL